MALIRGHHAFDDHFTQIPNAWLRDNELSLEARGLLSQIMSHRPGWSLSIKSLALQNKVGRDKVKRIIDELLKRGYLERSEAQKHDEKGRLSGFDYYTRDPQGVTQEPCKVKPFKAEPAKAIKPLKKTKPIEEHLDRTPLVKNVHSEPDFLESFNEFWSVFPRKQGKGKAKEAFMKAVGNSVHADDILAGARRYASDPNLPDPKFVPMPATWLNQERWDDGPLPLNRKLTNSERNFANLKASMTLLEPKKEVESGQATNASITDFGVNLRSADSY